MYIKYVFLCFLHDDHPLSKVVEKKKKGINIARRLSFSEKHYHPFHTRYSSPVKVVSKESLKKKRITTN